MKDSKSEIIDKIAADGDGCTVPEGYFADFAVKMSGRLPFREELDTPIAQQAAPKNTKWLRVRPYVYMAAMFAGAWCMLKMFSLMSPSAAEVSIENYPGLSQALENEQFIDEYIIDGVSSFDLIEDTYLESISEDDASGDADDEEAAPAAAPENEQPSYRLPTDGDYSTPPVEE